MATEKGEDWKEGSEFILSRASAASFVWSERKGPPHGERPHRTGGITEHDAPRYMPAVPWTMKRTRRVESICVMDAESGRCGGSDRNDTTPEDGNAQEETSKEASGTPFSSIVVDHSLTLFSSKETMAFPSHPRDDAGPNDVLEGSRCRMAPG